MGRGWVGSPGLEPSAIRMVACQTPGPMEHSQDPLWIFVHPHRDLHVMEPVRVLRNLQGQALIPHRIVLGHDPLVLHTQNLGEMRADPRDEGGARFGRPHHKPLVMLGEELLGQVPVGRRPLRNPGQGQFFGQSVLQGRKARSDRPRASGE